MALAVVLARSSVVSFVEVAMLALNELIQHCTGSSNAARRSNTASLDRFEEHVEGLVRARGVVVAWRWSH